MPITIKTKLIENNPELLELFFTKFKLLAGNPVELNYLKRATVRGFFRNDELVAGYVFNQQAPFRLLTWLPVDRSLANLPADKRAYLKTTYTPAHPALKTENCA